MNDTINEATLAQPAAEHTQEAPKESFDKLSNREALQKALTEHPQARPGQEAAPSSSEGAPTRTEVKAAVNADLEPPSEFSKEGKRAWTEKDIAGIQKEYKRINEGRLQELSRAQTSERQAREEARKERESAQTWRDLGKMAAPYIEARGSEGVAPEKAMMEALALIDAFKKSDPSTVKSELKRLGIDLDKAPDSKPSIDLQNDPTIATLQKTVSELTKERDAERLKKVVDSFDSSFNELSLLKTRAGEEVYPGLSDNSQTGLEFARELGSLATSPGFQALVRRRFPQASHTDFCREAYIQLGGKVSGEPAKVSQSNQQHIEKSRRAAASQPGRVAVRDRASSLVGKLSPRDALKQAIQDQRGH